MLSGKLILTEPDGTRHEYTPGDSLVLPVGYTGTWEIQGNYASSSCWRRRATSARRAGGRQAGLLLHHATWESMRWLAAAT